MEKGSEGVKRQGQIETQLGMQGKYLLEMESRYATLKERLGPALRQSSPTSENDKEAEQLVPVAEELRQHNNRITSLLESVDDILDRLEL